MFLAAAGGMAVVAAGGAAVDARGTPGAEEGSGGTGGPAPGAPAVVVTASHSDADADRPRPTPHPRDTLAFRHRDHRAVGCVTCHPSDDTHGGLAVERPSGCHECHHRSDDAPACRRCHSGRDLRGVDYGLRRPLELSTGTAPGRPLAFDHADHESAACRDCHTEGAELSAGDVACEGCHEDHHRLESRCAACHVDPPDEVHPVGVAHVTCAGSGCHTSLPFDRTPRSRQACLSCHQDLTDHRPRRACVECHPMPRREPEAVETVPEGDTG